MSMHANKYDIHEYVARFDHHRTPNLGRVACSVRDLMEWTNANSDGWCYWAKPSRAAKSATTVLHDKDAAYRRGMDVPDITDADARRLLSPIRAMLTRHGVNPDTVLISRVEK